MSDKFKVEIISPDKSILNLEADEVTIPSYEGQMGILKNHIPLITFLRPGIILIKAQEEKKYYVEEGTVEFSNDNLLILTSTAKELSSLDKNFIDGLLNQAEKKIKQRDH
jgi:F-type H+-transporting ATPase subunit epsilon/F-type H+-transporting ATPase subunit delta